MINFIVFLISNFDEVKIVVVNNERKNVVVVGEVCEWRYGESLYWVKKKLVGELWVLIVVLKRNV